MVREEEGVKFQKVKVKGEQRDGEEREEQFYNKSFYTVVESNCMLIVEFKSREIEVEQFLGQIIYFQIVCKVRIGLLDLMYKDRMFGLGLVCRGIDNFLV